MTSLHTTPLALDIDVTPAAPEYTFGPTGQLVYDRTYSRPLPRGGKEEWPDTVDRVVRGNLALVYGDEDTWSDEVREEAHRLRWHMVRFNIIPAGRHLWASGVKGRQFLFNCHVSGWYDKLSDHFSFTFLRLMEGGGVGANYSSRFLERFGAPRRQLNVHVVCDPEHQDFYDMVDNGLLSPDYDPDWDGSFEIEDSREGWAAALVDLIDTFMTDDEVKHANRVYDVSRVRPKGARLKTFGGTASGPGPLAKMLAEVANVLNGAWLPDPEHLDAEHISPVEAMEIDHAIAECVVSGGVRRSARMAIVHWKDEFISEFLTCKTDSGKHWTTNISVEIDDEFIDLLGMERLPDGDPMGGPNLAQWVHEQVVKGMLTNGEPGYWNSELSQVGEINELVATNPCGEIALPPSGACVLGHVNMDAFAPTRKGGPVDSLGLLEAHELMTRFVIRATFGDMNDAGQKTVMDSERRVGVGHFGVQGYFAKQGVSYRDLPKRRDLRRWLNELSIWVREKAREYAFELRIPEPVKVTTVAPTGTIAKLPGATEGIHPIYARHFIRRVRFNQTDADQAATLESYRAQGYKVEVDQYDQSGNTMVVELPTKELLVEQVEALGYSPAEVRELVLAADELSLGELLAVQALYQQEWADNAVSFTANVPEGLDPTVVAETIQEWLPVLKGTTIMVDGTRPQAPYERITEAEYEAAGVGIVADSTDDDCASGACPVR